MLVLVAGLLALTGQALADLAAAGEHRCAAMDAVHARHVSPHDDATPPADMLLQVCSAVPGILPQPVTIGLRTDHCLLPAFWASAPTPFAPAVVERPPKTGV